MEPPMEPPDGLFVQLVILLHELRCDGSSVKERNYADFWADKPYLDGTTEIICFTNPVCLAVLCRKVNTEDEILTTVSRLWL